MRKAFTFFICIVLLSACTPEETGAPEGTLAAAVENFTTGRVIPDSLIACAASSGDLSEELPLSVFFYPEGSATDFRYFETNGPVNDPDDFSAYREVVLETQPVFNGYLRRFFRPTSSENAWSIVTFMRDGDLYWSNPIRMKINNLPTEHNNDLLSIDQADNLSPVFSWEDGAIDDNVIYFQVVSDAEGNLISGTYTYERNFRFYDTSNVVLNIRDTEPAPALEANSDYNFLLMAVSDDNWVNLIATRDFSTE